MFFQRKKTFKVSINEIIKKVTKKTKIVFIANPNNPTGTYLTRAELIEIKNEIK